MSYLALGGKYLMVGELVLFTEAAKMVLVSASERIQLEVTLP